MPRTFKDYQDKYFEALEKHNKANPSDKTTALNEMFKYAVLMQQSATTNSEKTEANEQRARAHHMKGEIREAEQFAQMVTFEDPESFLSRWILYDIAYQNLAGRRASIDSTTVGAILASTVLETIKMSRKANPVLEQAEQLAICYERNISSDKEEIAYLLWMADVMIKHVAVVVSQIKFGGNKGKNILVIIYRATELLMKKYRATPPAGYEDEIEDLYEAFIAAKTLYK